MVLVLVEIRRGGGSLDVETLEMIDGCNFLASGSSPWLESSILSTGTCLSLALRQPIRLTTYQHKLSDRDVQVRRGCASVTEAVQVSASDR